MGNSRFKKKFIASVAVSLCGVFAVTVPVMLRPSETQADVFQVKIEPQYMQTVARSMLPLLNKWRAGSTWYYDSSNKKVYLNNLKPLTYDYTLEKHAMQRAAEIAISFDHTRPRGDSKTGISGYMAFAENIAATTNKDGGLAEYALDMYKEENYPYSGQGHRRLMLSVPGNFSNIGIACVFYRGAYYWVQTYGMGSKPDTRVTVAFNGYKTMTVDVETSMLTSRTADLSEVNDWKAALKKGETDFLPNVYLSIGTDDTWPYPATNVQGVPNWSSSNNNTVTVNSSAGTITAVNSGAANVTMNEPITEASKSKTVSVTDPNAVTGVSLNKTTLALNTGASSTLTATVSPVSAPNKSVTWSSSNTAVATVSSSGVVKGIKAGTATITVRTASGGKTATCKVTVAGFTGVKKEGGVWKVFKNGAVDTSFTGLNQASDGNWYYFKKGVHDATYTGVAKSTNGNLYFVTKGLWDTTYTGLGPYSDGKWYFVRKGRHVPSYTGIAKSTNGKLYFAKNGIWDTTYTGLGQYVDGDGKWYYVRGGCHVPTYTGIAKSTNGKLYFAKNGIWDTTYTGLGQYSDGKWYYVRGGCHVPTYTGIAKSTNGNLYFARNGLWDTTYTGLGQYSDGKWYYVKDGRHVPTYTGIAKSTNGNLYFARNGLWDTTYTGLGQYSDGKWYYVRDGRYLKTYTGIAKSTNGKLYYVKDGLWDTTFTGTAEDENGKSYKVVDGRV